MKLSRELYQQMVAHARAEAPNECCALLGAENGRASSFYPARNRFESPMRFEIHPDDMIRIYNETERRGEEIAVLFHSHPKTDAYPSQTDINMAAKVAIWWPDVVWVIASLTDSEPILRAFKIDGPQVEEVDLVVE